MLAPTTQNFRHCSLLLSGTRDTNVSDLALSIVSDGVINASCPSTLVLTDTPTEGETLVRREQDLIRNALRHKEGGERTAEHKCQTVSYMYNTLTFTPAKLRHIIFEKSLATAPFYIVRDDTSQTPGDARIWFAYANEILESVRATIIHVVKTGPMGEMPVDPAQYSVWWEAKDYAPPYRERTNNALVLTDHSTGKKQIWRERPVSGGAAVWLPALDEEVA